MADLSKSERRKVERERQAAMHLAATELDLDDELALFDFKDDTKVVAANRLEAGLLAVVEQPPWLNAAITHFTIALKHDPNCHAALQQRAKAHCTLQVRHRLHIPALHHRAA